MGIKSSKFCSFCQNAIETISHVYWYCPRVKIFIKEVLSHIKQKYNMTVNINVSSWFFLNNITRIEIIVIIISKYIIHKAKINESTLSLQAMLKTLRAEAEKEHNLYKLKNEVHKFEDKWGELAKILC